MAMTWLAYIRSILARFDQTQWMTAEQIRAEQFRQAAHIVSHAYRTVPYYREHFTAAGTRPEHLERLEHLEQANLADDWHRIPRLSRGEVRRAGSELKSTAIPKGHQRTFEKKTGGSTGTPVTVLGTTVTQLWWFAINLRDHLWHQRDFRKKLAVIRYLTEPQHQPPNGSVASNWNAGCQALSPTGPCVSLAVNSSPDIQLRWLERHNPGYIMAYPSVIHTLADHAAETNTKLSNLQEVRTFGEALEPSTQEICREVWGVEVVDLYSSEEVGHIALQCPQMPHYHVQAEDLLVEVLDEQDRPCAPGEVGRVVVTTLNNYAMPLLRYEIGDYAQLGEPCPCGRGLPVLKQILGRQRNMFILPSGEKRWPNLIVTDDEPPLPPHQFQVAQRSRTLIELRLVTDLPFSPSQQEQAIERVRRGLGNAFEYRLVFVDEIPRSPRGKYEDFVCELTGASKAATMRDER